MDVEYVYQDVETIPEEKRNPKRTALYGSVRAVLMGEELIDAPFGVINAVNFYQRESFELLYNNLVALKDAGYHSFNVCYRLKNVLAESGGVTWEFVKWMKRIFNFCNRPYRSGADQW